MPSPDSLLLLDDGQFDPVAEDVAAIIGAHNHRTAALRLLLEKVRARLQRTDAEVSQYLASRPRDPAAGR